MDNAVLQIDRILYIGLGLVVVFVIGVFVRIYLEAARRRDKYNRATPATARVLHVGRSYTSGMWGGQDMDFTMRVMPPNASPYEVKTTWSVEPLSMPKIKEGAELQVRIDTSDPNRIYSAEPWAWSWHQTPLRYGNKIVIGYRIR